ncbi:MAG: BlaI/MecI/CopY family transcriptional regulator [Oscillospiraceae bacterium]|jgi:predicted transcriptional regulator|nr:BlaI/MecI/CopY family transcriptional regulator [Oscillospiraceae bacterium]
MTEFRLTQMESRFAELVWAHAPIGSPELVKLCAREMDWKKSTTYTVLKKLCDKGIFVNENATVSVRLTKEAFYAGQSRRYIEDTFGGSLPGFLAAFIGGRKLTDGQAEELKRLIDAHVED